MADWKTELNPFLTGSKSRTDENDENYPIYYAPRRLCKQRNLSWRYSGRYREPCETFFSPNAALVSSSVVARPYLDTQIEVTRTS